MLKVFLEPEHELCKKKNTYEEQFSYLRPWTWSLPFSTYKSAPCNKDLFINNQLKISQIDSGYYMKISK